ncbi:MAG: hypothetical protein EAZ97_02585 [Bacteroidetes bacterium]|nr:MAG: hypothetical protein EAZ97_02585 [Bacteroidota bacterium]
MAFTNYKNIKAIKDKFPKIKVISELFIPENLPAYAVRTELKNEMLFNLKTYRSNEFYAAEHLISPILREVWKPYCHEMNFWTHQAIRFDDDLCGVPDYMFTNLEDSQYEFLSYPLLATVEAKAENFEEGWGQCLAQMIAFREINQKPNMTVYGIVTTGKFWEIGKFANNILTKHSISFAISNLTELLTVLDYILQESKKQLILFKPDSTKN